MGSTQDPDAHLRESLTADAAAFCQRLGRKPDLIAVSGDIAFAGSPSEYAFAFRWLQDLCTRCGVDLSKVLVIPGNHDVVRETTKQPLIQMLHKELRGTSALMLDSAMGTLLKNADSGPLLYKSIEPFNEFAAKLSCSLYPPNRTICERKLPFQKSWIVRFLGVNSTFISGENDKERDLCVDVAAKQITLPPGTINVVLCHHPYSWLKNGDEFSDHLATVSQLHLFGHVHTNRIELNRDFVRVSASAAHPERQEHGWEPGYNFIELDLTGTEEFPLLLIRVHVRVWQQRPAQFRPKEDRKRLEYFEQEIALEHWTPTPSTSAEADSEHSNVAEAPINPSEETIMDNLRSVSLRFFGLTASQRALLAGKLDLVDEQDKNLPEFERTRKLLLRAKNKNLLPTLAEAMDEVAR